LDYTSKKGSKTNTILLHSLAQSPAEGTNKDINDSQDKENQIKENQLKANRQKMTNLWEKSKPFDTEEEKPPPRKQNTKSNFAPRDKEEPQDNLDNAKTCEREMPNPFNIGNGEYKMQNGGTFSKKDSERTESKETPKLPALELPNNNEEEKETEKPMLDSQRRVISRQQTLKKVVSLRKPRIAFERQGKFLPEMDTERKLVHDEHENDLK